MNYYEVALKGYFLDALTYESEADIELYSEVLVELGRKKNVKAVVLKKVPKPKFATKAISEVLSGNLSNEQMQLANFISSYYTCKLSFVLG